MGTAPTQRCAFAPSSCGSSGIDSLLLFLLPLFAPRAFLTLPPSLPPLPSPSPRSMLVLLCFQSGGSCGAGGPQTPRSRRQRTRQQHDLAHAAARCHAAVLWVSGCVWECVGESVWRTQENTGMGRAADVATTLSYIVWCCCCAAVPGHLLVTR